MCEALKEIVREDMQEEFEAAESRGRYEGISRGRSEGRNEGIKQMECLIRNLITSSRFDEIERAVNDKEYQEHLFEEFGL